MDSQQLRVAFGHYYAQPAVRERLLEYLGGESLERATCRYLVSAAPSLEAGFAPRPVGDLWRLLEEQLEVARSLWDRRSLLVHLDFEYVNFDRPWEAYLDPAYSYEMQRPVVAAARRILGGHGIVPLHLLTGRGHHFVWRLDLGSDAVARLVRLGEGPTALAAAESPPRPGNPAPVLRAAWAGLGLVMEHLGHRLLEAAAEVMAVPVQLTAVEAGPVRRGREIVSIDVSAFGDPIEARMIRLPFSGYMKAWALRDYVDPSLHDRLAPVVMLPLLDLEAVDAAHREEDQVRLAMRDLEAAARLAAERRVLVPEASGPMQGLIARYESSRLAAFHRDYYQPVPPAVARACRTMRGDVLPPCARRILQDPNDLLLKPAALQLLVRALMALGWPPREIADHVLGTYREDHGWVQDVHFHDPFVRADFYTRLFAGLVLTGRDDLVDFNCRSTQEKGYCGTFPCGDSLDPFQVSLKARRFHGRLAGGPVNGLLL